MTITFFSSLLGSEHPLKSPHINAASLSDQIYFSYQLFIKPESRPLKWFIMRYSLHRNALTDHQVYQFYTQLTDYHSYLVEWLVLAVSKVLIAPTSSNLCNFITERDTTKKRDQIDKSLKDLTVLFHAYLTYLLPFQSYGGLKKFERSILLRLLVRALSL